MKQVNQRTTVYIKRLELQNTLSGVIFVGYSFLSRADLPYYCNNIVERDGNNTYKQKRRNSIGRIPGSHTNEYRDSYNILDSDGIAVIIEEEEGGSSDAEEEGDGNETVCIDIKGTQQYEDRQSCKRGLSTVSVASFTSTTRDESPTKKHQGAAE